MTVNPIIRIGGRIHSVPFGDDGETEDQATVESEATWIHGKGPVNELADAFDLIDYGLTEDEYHGMYAGSNGTKCYEELVRKSREEFRKITEELYENKLSASSLTLYPSVLGYIQNRLDQVVGTLPDNDRDGGKDICRTLMKVEEYNHGAALEDVSVFIPDNIIPGNNISLTGGYYALIPRLAHTVTDKTIHIHTKVINIGYTIHLCESENGTIMYTASHVIVTNSLGVLKKISPDTF
ncbi:Peroxisomal N(1)-acetyl-spermine/spermidine oxidase [Mizuhopecten yessoensis]|uniref:Peroxisomal N(1)-acetyl-spermine/spermidine oxidase n=1 Tax=Mizuhopecten yessoensis TaxID=6573 RepID=A0A210PIB6_MIZYE|nr:Peroxisomal N(1)-acetyl-spermine/spermidine oxidase [Mizuhopecten yessoensis]